MPCVGTQRPDSTPCSRECQCTGLVVSEQLPDVILGVQARSREEERVFIAPYDDPYTIAGQGTVGQEILREVRTAWTPAVPPVMPLSDARPSWTAMHFAAPLETGARNMASPTPSHTSPFRSIPLHSVPLQFIVFHTARCQTQQRCTPSSCR